MEYGKEEVWFRVEKNDYKRFLQFAKDNGCVWINNKDINPETDVCGHFMGMYNYYIGYISSMIYCKYHEEKKVIDFATIK